MRGRCGNNGRDVTMWQVQYAKRTVGSLFTTLSAQNIRRANVKALRRKASPWWATSCTVTLPRHRFGVPNGARSSARGAMSTGHLYAATPWASEEDGHQHKSKLEWQTDGDAKRTDTVAQEQLSKPERPVMRGVAWNDMPPTMQRAMQHDLRSSTERFRTSSLKYAMKEVAFKEENRRKGRYVRTACQYGA